MHNENNIIKNNVKKFRLLTEWVSRNDVADAIENRDIVYIYYAGDETVNKGFRIIEPYALGRTSAGNLAVRAWQQAGATDSGVNPSRQRDEIPGWRLFRLDGITTFAKTQKKFGENNEFRPKYNPNDKGLDVMVAVDPDAEQSIELSGTDSINKPDVFKTLKGAKFKGFDSASKGGELLLKKAVFDTYNYIKRKQKKDASNYIIVNKNNELKYDKESNRDKYNEDEVLGNLNKLFRKFYSVGKSRVDKGFIQRQKQELLKSMEDEVQGFEQEIRNQQ